MCAQVDKAQYERVLSYIDHGKREGATLLTGGRPCGPEGKGYYIEPTVFTNVKVRRERTLVRQLYTYSLASPSDMHER